MLFSSIIGQQTVKQRLIQAVQDNRIAHAQLFFGAEGSGSLALAIAFAQYLSCEDRNENDSCGKCSSCVKYNKLIHPDLHFSYPTAPVKDRKAKSAEYAGEWREAVLENPYLSLQDWYEFIGIENKQGYMSVEESGEIIRHLTLKSYESKYRVMIIWMAEKMRTDASNKLLKIIEEPPDNTIFILVTENYEQIIQTILSRTQLVKVNRVSDKELSDAIKEKFSLSNQEAQRIVHLADGNYNAAQSLAKQESGSIEIEKEFIDWMRMCVLLNKPDKQREYFKMLNDWIDVMAKAGRERQKNFLHYGLEIARECLMTNYADASLVRINDEVIPTFSRFVKFINYQNADLFTEELNKASFHIERNANPRILFLDLSFKMNRILQG
ncbi:MAG: ATP-binding protein [Bacteroidia bacterium]